MCRWLRSGCGLTWPTIYLRASDHKRATEQLQAILRDDPTNPQAHYYLGRLALEDKKPAEAADHFSKTVLLSPDLETALLLPGAGAN